MARAKRTCPTCHHPIPPGATCRGCTRASDHARRPNGNPYGAAHRRLFREPVLRRDPICVICRKAWATIADHYPRSRHELITAGDNPNNPAYGRGLCKPCHDTETACHQPGGWHNQHDRNAR